MQALRGGGFLGKRKVREHGYNPSSSTSSSEQAMRTVAPPPPFFAKPDPRTSKPDRPAVARLGADAKPALPPPPPPAANNGATGNKLLAGYLAHEFLTCGTLLGERRREAPPIPKEKQRPAPEPGKRYAEVSRLLMAGGARIPGIFNPSQLGAWLRIKE